MSLYKQLWLGVVFLLTLVFGGSLLVSSLSAKAYLEQQLYMKNTDNATALALSLSQQAGGEVLLESTLAAQFDAGFYEMIELINPEGRATVRRQDSGKITGTPAWFMTLLPIEVEPGVALVQRGGKQLGTLTVRSHSRFAYSELWAGAKKMAVMFCLAIVLAGLLGSFVLKKALRPLDNVVSHAEAIGQRRFIVTNEPKTHEFKQVVMAMNKLSLSVKQALKQEAKRREKWQREAHVDKVTGLLSREPFIQAVHTALESDEVNATGSLSLIRISGLARLNENYGRKAIDSVLKDVGSTLNRIVMQHSSWAASRLNGSDFALLAPRSMEPGEAALEAQAAIREILQNRSMPSSLELPGAATIFAHGDNFGALMTRLDGALLSADHDGHSSISIAHKGDIPLKSVRDQMQEWRTIFNSAFREKKFRLGAYPVVGLENNLLHYESPARLEWQGNEFSAGEFLPWINRLEVSPELDREVVGLALQMIEKQGQPLCVNLTVAAVMESSFLSWLSEKLSSHAIAASKLWLEIPEPMAFRHLTNFKLLCTKAKAYGCKMGIEHMGHQLADLGQLHNAGVDYFKVDASFVRDIDSNTGNQTLLRTLCAVGHSIGVIVIAEGIRSDAEWAMLQELGADGGTGPGISEPGVRV
jgi:EAL domain-containing protein (putative c-di-GMP-specific phosphodiesterase class I)/GGDEF domain-containing protein